MNNVEIPWQTALSEVVTNIEELCNLLELPAPDLKAVYPAISQFALRVPKPFLARMRKGDPNDPLLRQVIASSDEMVNSLNFNQDPLVESEFSPVPGLLHKYYGRVLVVLTGSCAINCRYCFRRHFPYEQHVLGRSNFEKIVDYIANDSTIEEVILSGGEPLLLKDQILADYVQRLANIPHISRLRIHSRLPIVIPARITTEFIEAITSTRLQPVIVLHCNHANEIDDGVFDACAKLRNAQISLFNQAVLLKDVNDTIDAQITLAKTAFAAGIMPYYLHLLDSVAGAEHFLVDEQQAKKLYNQMQARLPGYMLLKLAREIPGRKSKTLIYTQ